MDVIRDALSVVLNLVNAYMENLDQSGGAWVTMTSLVDHDGTLNQSARDKVVMIVYNITRETVFGTYQPTAASKPPQGAGDSFAMVAPPLYVNVHLMFMANFSENTYPDGLAALSRVISFFQQNPYFNHNNAPALSPDIDKLTLEFENLSPVDVNYVMGMLGTRYLPSVFYKLRMLPFASTAMQGRAYAVAGAGVSGPGPAGPAE